MNIITFFGYLKLPKDSEPKLILSSSNKSLIADMVGLSLGQSETFSWKKGGNCSFSYDSNIVKFTKERKEFIQCNVVFSSRNGVSGSVELGLGFIFYCIFIDNILVDVQKTEIPSSIPDTFSLGTGN